MATPAAVDPVRRLRDLKRAIAEAEALGEHRQADRLLREALPVAHAVHTLRLQGGTS